MRPNHLFGSHFLLSCQISYCSNTYYTTFQKRNLNAIYRCPIRYNSVYLEPCVIKRLVRKPFVAVNGQTGVQCRSARFAYVSLLPLQVLYRCIYQFQLLLRGTGQLLDIFRCLLGLELRQLLPKLLLCLL